MNNDLISREALKEKAETVTLWNGDVRRFVSYETIDNAPTVAEDYDTGYQDGLEDGLTDIRPQGEWYYNYQNGWHCSICYENVKDMPTVMGKAYFKFCPNCGAKMKDDTKQ